MSNPGRTATRLCAACRSEAKSSLTRSTFSTAALERNGRIPTTATSRTHIPIPSSHRWLSQTAAPLDGSAPSPSSVPPQDQPFPPTPDVPRYYALFPETLPLGPPPAGPFEIDVRALRREFLRLQAAAHPDFHHHAATDSSSSHSSARRHAEAASSLINSAYKTLASPLARAEYLLREVHGFDLAGDERGAETAAEPEVFMTVLEAREAIEEAEREEDLGPVRRENEERIRAAEEALAAAFAEGDVPAARAEAVRLRYWMNIRESVDNWERGKPVVLEH